MVLRGAQIQRCGQARCSLVSAQSFPHDLARLYGRTLPLTSTDLGGGADPYIDEVRTWTDSHGRKSLPATRARCRVARLPRNQSPDAERTFSMYPVIALIVLMLFTWIVAIWASCDDDDDSEEPHDVEKPEKSSDEHEHRKSG